MINSMTSFLWFTRRALWYANVGGPRIAVNITVLYTIMDEIMNGKLL